MMFRPYTLWAVRLSCENSARLAILKMGRGIRTLNMIAATAPMLGGVALMDGLRQALMGWSPPAYGDVGGGWSEMFVPFATSLATASLALVCYRSLFATIERLRAETEITTLAE
jgi:biopolymer transport protein ExbB/TolQ